MWRNVWTLRTSRQRRAVEGQGVGEGHGIHTSRQIAGGLRVDGESGDREVVEPHAGEGSHPFIHLIPSEHPGTGSW